MAIKLIAPLPRNITTIVHEFDSLEEYILRKYHQKKLKGYVKGTLIRRLKKIRNKVGLQ